MSDEAQHAQHQIDYVEISVRNMREARQFYASAFDWRFNEYGPNYLGIQKDGGGESGGLCLAEKMRTGGPLVVIYSNDLDMTLERVRNAGGRITKDPFSFPGGRRFHFLDPSDNELAVWSQVAAGPDED
ncbi:MAG: VOC family protein [Proteobacteria bacterium]|nr:VOC family protein [Pseudomonadota bacterium]